MEIEKRKTPKFEPGEDADAEAMVLQGALAAFIPTLTGKVSDEQSSSMQDTPRRFVKALVELTEGYEMNPEEILTRVFEQEFDEMIVVSDIDFTSLCEHHLLPFIGTATVGYIPNGSVVGLSKIPRVVDCYARRLQLQERMAVEIADAIETVLKPQGVGVILKAAHQCMSCRGVRKPGARMITSVLRGEFKSDPTVRAEFLAFKN